MSSPDSHHGPMPGSAFPQIQTRVNSSLPEFKSNAETLRAILADFDAAWWRLVLRASLQHLLRSIKHASYWVRDLPYCFESSILLIMRSERPSSSTSRPWTAFLELCGFAGHHLEDSSPSASLVAGIRVVRYATVPLHFSSRLPLQYSYLKSETSLLNSHRVII
jgi:hypothetical protein